MEDSIDYKTNRIPLLGQIPLFGEMFTNRDNVTRKTELVIFLRPIVIRDARVVGDYAGFREQLPQGNFFATPPGYPQAMPFVFGDNRP